MVCDFTNFSFGADTVFLCRAKGLNPAGITNEYQGMSQMSTASHPRPARRVSPNPPSPKRRSKQESLRIVQALKRGTLIASIFVFGVFVALIARHNVHASTSTLSGGNTLGASTPGTQFDSPSGGSPHDFFNNQGQGGYGFGAGNNQPPVTGSSSS